MPNDHIHASKSPALAWSLALCAFAPMAAGCGSSSHAQGDVAPDAGAVVDARTVDAAATPVDASVHDGDGAAPGDASIVSQVDAAPPAVCSLAEDAYATPIDMAPFTITSALWKARLKAMVTTWIPHLYGELSNLSLPEGGMANFVQAARKLKGQSAAGPVGYPFANAYVFNAIESMALALMLDPGGDQDVVAAQTALRADLGNWIPTVLSAQESDGYLQTYITLGTTPRWTDNTLHEGYVGGYFIEAAIAHYLMSNRTDTTLLDAARKLADCWSTNIGPSPKKLWWDGHEEMEHALTRLARLVDEQGPVGAGDKYTALAKFLLDSRGSGNFAPHQEYDQSYAAPTSQKVAVGHAVRAAYLYTAMTHVGMLAQSPAYLSAANTIWTDLTTNKMYVNAGIGSDYDNEGFSDTDYDLPNVSYCEGCSASAMIFFQHAMGLAHKDARYADIAELALYNTLMGAVDLTGNYYGYQNPLDQNWSRYAWNSCPCCVGNIPRTLLEIPRWMYAKSNTSLYVNQYVGSSVDVGAVAGTDVKVVQSTDYPWAGRVTLTVNPATATAFTLKVRIPNRAVSPTYTDAPTESELTSISVNGQPITPTIVAGYAVVCRTWSPGDTVDLDLPLQPIRVTASSKLTADVGRTALQFGPMVYNIEDVDYGGADLDQFVLPPTAALTSQWNGSLLDGVVVVQGTFADGTPMTAIPHYARLNRGGTRSMVWIKNR